MCVYTYYNIMRKSKDKRFIRYQMVLYAEEHGKKSAERESILFLVEIHKTVPLKA